jgi:hypothetical protein
MLTMYAAGCRVRATRGRVLCVEFEWMTTSPVVRRPHRRPGMPRFTRRQQNRGLPGQDPNKKMQRQAAAGIF